MAPIMDIPNENDYQKMIKIADAVGINYSVPKQEPEIKVKDDLGFIYVHSIKLEVARNKILHGKNFYNTQEALHSNNQRMLTIPEFREFLKYTRQNHKDIYNEITQVRSPWRAEWLDADFKVEGKDLVVYYHIFENGKIVKKSEKLDKNTLMEDKTPGISLENWLEDSTNQGLPKDVVKSGKLYYWCPDKDNNSVARFGANDVWSDLDCIRVPSGRGSGLGVRAAKLRE
jgi:hypothetical protein